MESFLRDQYIYAFLVGYITWGIISHFAVKKIMSRVWERTTLSYKKMYPRNKVPPELDSEKRKPFNWAPSTIGVFERILYTSAIIFNQVLLIGIWAAFKIIGEWSDISSSSKKSSKNADGGVSRIRANNFLIGNALSLIFGILGGVIFWLVVNPNFIVERLQNSYP